tara:strand:- start:917 stop:2182 length:1266 start_codon:yes stop_codon:yes gene_type:complete
MIKAKNFLAASALLEQGLGDILSLQTEREKIRSAGLLGQQKITSEALGTQYKAAQQFYNTLMASDDKSSDEFKVFADRAWSNLKEIENTYNKFHGISNLPQVSAMQIFQHEISFLPEGMTSWNDSLLEAMKRKPSYADVPEDVWQGLEVIWKASQPKAKESDKKAAGNFLGAENITPFLPNPEGTTLDELIPSAEDVKKFEEEGTLIERLGEFLIPSADAADFRSGSDKGRVLPKERIRLEDEHLQAIGMAPLIPLGLLAMAHQQKKPRNEISGMSGTDQISTGMDYYFNPNAPLEDERNLRSASTYGAQARSGSFPIRDDERYPYSFPETSQLIPNSAVQELQSLDQKSIGTGTGGILSFAEGLKVSNKVIEFLKELAMYEDEYGEAQARKYVSKEFAKLSEKEQEEVVEILELQKMRTR